MQTQKLFTVEIHRVERYSSRVLVRASSAKEAKSIVEAEFNDDEYLYEKTTDSPDDATTTFTNARAVKPADQGAEYARCLWARNVENPAEGTALPNTCIKDSTTGRTLLRMHCKTYLSVLVAFREFVFDKAASGKYGEYPADDTFNDAVEEGFSEEDTVWTSHSGVSFKIVSGNRKIRLKT